MATSRHITHAPRIFASRAALLLVAMLAGAPSYGKPPAATKVVHRIPVTAAEAQRRGVYDIMKLYMDGICIKEVPFFIALHRCFSVDTRIERGKTLVLTKRTILELRDRAVALHRMRELAESDIDKIDSLVLYKKRENRYNRYLCNFEVFVTPGKCRIPKTGAGVIAPQKVFGSIFYSRKADKMVVYIHCGGVKLELPRYAKAMSLGILDDLDVGFAELEMVDRQWVARLLYMKKVGGVRTGWSFNATECNKIRPHTE